MVISIGNSWPARCRPRSSSRLLTTGASPVSRKRRMPVVVRLAKRRRDDRLGEVAPERLVPRPAERLLRLRVPRRRCCRPSPCRRTRRARCRGSGGRAHRFRPRGRAPRGGVRRRWRRQSGWRSRSRSSARRSSTSAAPPTCSTQRTPLTTRALAQRHVEHRADVLGLEIDVEESARARVGPARRAPRSRARIRARRSRPETASRAAARPTRAGRRCGGTGRRSRWRCARRRSATCSPVRPAASPPRLRECRAADPRTVSCGSACRAVSSVSALLCAASRCSLSRSARSAVSSSLMSSNTVSTAGSSFPRHQPRRGAGPERAASRVPQLEQHVVGLALALQRLGQQPAVLGVDVVVGREAARRLRRAGRRTSPTSAC